jgi:hypothetical protein
MAQLLIARKIRRSMRFRNRNTISAEHRANLTNAQNPQNTAFFSSLLVPGHPG